MIELLSTPEATDDVSIADMTKAELLAYAEANGIDGVSNSMLKADMIAAIRAAESE